MVYYALCNISQVFEVHGILIPSILFKQREAKKSLLKVLCRPRPEALNYSLNQLHVIQSLVN